MTRIPMRTHGRFVRRYPTRYGRNITYSLGAVRLAVPGSASVGAPDSGERTQRNAFYRISGRVEAAAPAQVVAPASGWYTAPSPEGDPVSLLGFRYPRSLDTALLVQGYDVAHPNRVGEASMVGQP